MGALGTIGDQSSLTVLAAVARADSDDSNRASAVEAIFRIGGPRAKELLIEVAESDKDKRIRDRARRSVNHLEEQGD